MAPSTSPLMRRETSESRGRHLVASEKIRKGQLIFAERPMIVMQSTGNVHSGVLVCRYCMAFCGSPEQALQIAANPICLPAITTKKAEDQDQQPQQNNGEHALIPCRHLCGQVYCSMECQQDDWEWGGHKELCTGCIDDIDHPLVKFKQHAVETNEIFLIIGQWLARILKHNLPYHDDDRLHTHPYTDFQMNAWWDVITMQLKEQPMGFGEAMAAEQSCRRLCEESSAFLREAWPEHNDSKWLQPLGLGRLIGSLEQNCVGVRRKHALRQNIMEDAELRHSCHPQLIKCLENAEMIGDDGDETGGCEDDACCTDEEAINEDASEASDTNKASNDEEKKSSTTILSPDEEWDYSPEDIAMFLSGLEASPDLGKDDEWDDVFIPLDGTAHFSTLTKMNHACDPNVIVLYNTRGWGKGHPLVAHSVALKDIEAGEELTISYITSDDPLEERQSALAHYGFVCTCTKCEYEKENPPAKGGKEGGKEEETDDLFGNDGDENDDDGDDLFGDDESNASENAAAYQEELDSMSGEAKLTQLAARLESCLNQSDIASIPLTYLAPVSNYVMQGAKDFLDEIKDSTEESITNDTVMIDLSKKCVEAVQQRDFCSCRVLGADLESHLFRLLKSNGSFPHPSFRKSYWCAGITAAIGFAQEGSFLAAMHYLDKVVMLGQNRGDIESFFSYVEIYASQMAAAPCPPAITCHLPYFNEKSEELRSLLESTGLSKPLSSPVDEFTGAMEDFSTTLQQLGKKPMVVRGLASEWPATRTWRNIANLAREFGHRLVPIEVGSMSTGMKEELVSFREFVATYLAPSSEKVCWSLQDATGDDDVKNKVAYLAQHPLLDQIPALYKDVKSKPCGISPTNVNAWIGTGGTRTPLHFDSYDNLFVQIVGAKYVRLYDASLTNKLYVSNDGKYGLQGNMSEIECEMEDLDKYPLLKDCPYTEVLMYPGDCLYIPSRHWHYVRSLSTSISVNYWF